MEHTLQKTCKTCGVLKNLEDFKKDKQAKDGYKNKCKACVNEYERNRVKGKSNTSSRIKKSNTYTSTSNTNRIYHNDTNTVNSNINTSTSNTNRNFNTERINNHMEFTDNEVKILKLLVKSLKSLELDGLEFKQRIKRTYSMCKKVDEMLENYNKETGINKSDIVNIAVQQYFNSKKDS